MDRPRRPRRERVLRSHPPVRKANSGKDEGVHLAMYFPGGSIPGQDPFDDRLAWVTLRALEQAGAVVVPVHYDDDVLQQDRARFESGVRRELRGALDYYEPSRVTLVGKSRGTFALQL